METAPSSTDPNTETNNQPNKEANDESEPDFGKGIDISEDEARQALLEYVSQQDCFGKSAAKEMVITKLTPSSAIHYVLETFCEGRLVKGGIIPYSGGSVDGPENGEEVGPWKVHFEPNKDHFMDKTVEATVPHTSFVKTCSNCHGSRKVSCGFCHASGYRKCNSCSGRGEKQNYRNGERVMERCSSCNGRGENRCSSCNGRGERECGSCDGYGELKLFKYVECVYTNYVTQYVLEQSSLPKGLLMNAVGVTIFEDIKQQVNPITKFPIASVNENSVRLVEEAKQKHVNEIQHNQRHSLRAIPVTQVDYTYKKFSSRFWVYGLYNSVYAPDYPQQSCYGCSILYILEEVTNISVT